MSTSKRSIRTVGAVAASAGVLAIVLGRLALTVRPTGGQTGGWVSAEGGPRFRADGPDADSFGRGEGYPVCKSSEGLENARQRCRIGAFSHFDQLFPSRTIKASPAPTRLGRAAVEPAISYTYNGQRQTIDQYLDKHPVTGLLIAKGDSILVERYQYGRTDTQRLTSFSMAKTIVALLIGIAVREGAIRSIDERAEVYVPELKGTEYGRTPIKALLQMASGWPFGRTTRTRPATSRSLGGPRWARNPAAPWPRSRGSTPLCRAGTALLVRVVGVGIQALSRTQPLLPLRPGLPARQTHDYRRNGLTSLYAALEVASGKVVGECRPRHTGADFVAFLERLASTYRHGELHVILDNSSTHTTPAVDAWLAAHPRVRFHFTPTGASWLNLVEAWFSILTRKSVRRGSLDTVRALIRHIERYLAEWNAHPTPFVWTKEPADIIRKALRRRHAR